MINWFHVIRTTAPDRKTWQPATAASMAEFIGAITMPLCVDHYLRNLEAARRFDRIEATPNFTQHQHQPRTRRRKSK